MASRKSPSKLPIPPAVTRGRSTTSIRHAESHTTAPTNANVKKETIPHDIAEVGEKPRRGDADRTGVTDLERGKAPPFCELKKAITPAGVEVIYVGWDHGESGNEDDPADPRHWPVKQKWLLSSIGFVFCSLVSIHVSGYSIVVGSIQEELGASRELVLVGLTLFTLTFGAAPLILAPLSEVWGRKPIYLGSAIIFWMFQLPQALATNITTILVARFIAGIGGSTAVSLVGGTLTDLFTNEERGLPMAAFAFAAFAPTGLGPVMFGYTAQNLNFRYSFWITFALAGVFTILLAIVGRETREGALLSKKAAKIRKETGDKRYVAQADEERASLSTIIKVSLSRPMRLFFTEPLLMAFTVWVSFAWAVLYLLLVSIPIVFTTIYGFNTGEVGLVYITQIVGSFLGMFISLYGDKLYHRDVGKKGPEARMWMGCFGGVIFPIGCWFFAWTSWASVHWIVPCIGIAILYSGLLLVYLTVFNYLADSFTLYAASALAGMNVWRNTIGAVFPLFGSNVYDSLGIHGAGSLVAGIATVLAVVPFIGFAYGGRIRAKSRFAREMEEMKAQADRK